MLDPKYALKYQMPHSVVHIVDNSAASGVSTPVVVDDPSLYATIVVTGCPMGVDRQMITLNRTDIASIAFGLGNLTTDDIKRYGQTVEYPMSLLTNANVPIRFMRVTPEGSTYAISTIVVQWRQNNDGEGGNAQIDVRFQTYDPVLLTSLRLDRFKNPEKLNAAIVANVPKTVGTGDNVWNQRVFMNIISAGRGKAYNDFLFAIDLGNQQKRAMNCRYVFSTINSFTTRVVEQFSASLINKVNNAVVNMTSNPIESVNVTVGRRVPGSSILIPFVNESAIGEVFNAWTGLCAATAESLSETDYRMWKTTDVNTFDVVFGEYIYDGDEYNLKLPRYHVQMETNDVKRLDENHRLTMSQADYTQSGPTAVFDKLKQNTRGINDGESSIYVGDVYLTAVGGYGKPRLTFISTLNQYTGMITPMNIAGIYAIPEFDTEKFYFDAATGGNQVTTKPADWDTSYTSYYVADTLEGDRTQLTKTTAVSEILGYFDDVPNVVDFTADPLTVNLTAVQQSTVLKRLVTNKTIPTPTSGSADVYVAYVSGDMVVFLKLTISDQGAFTAAEALDFDADFVAQMALTASDNQKLVAFQTTDTPATTEYPVGSVVITTAGAVNVVDYNNTSSTGSTLIPVAATPVWDETKFYFTAATGGSPVTEKPANWDTAYTTYYVADTIDGARVKVPYTLSNRAKFGAVPTQFSVTRDMMGTEYDVMVFTTTPPTEGDVPIDIYRWEVTGTIGSLYRAQQDPVDVPKDYYTASYGINPSAESGGVKLENGSTGFLDDPSITDIEFKYRYSALLVEAYRGQIDPSILSPIRFSAKYLFDGGTNTVVSQTVLPNAQYDANTIINASTIFTDEEKEAILLDPSITNGIEFPAKDIDVKQAMYDLMIERVYLRIPEDKRPIGPGYGLELHLDSGVSDAETIAIVNDSFNRRFTNSNCSWDLGGTVATRNALPYTHMMDLVEGLLPHLKRNTINKPYAQGVTAISPDKYISYFPNIDMTDWELRNAGYLLGGNMWVPDINGNLIRTSQRTMKTDNTTSDLIQESNMRTLSQLCYLLQNKIDTKLFEYYDDDVLKSMETECNLMFTGWVGSRVDYLDIKFKRDTNPTDGGEIVVCWVVVKFRGLILRVPIIVDVQRRTS